jgi:coatomer protein complex subunit gamma
MQEARLFNESPISRRKSRALLTRIVYLLYIGENFGTQEATTLFFGTTKLFQHKDVRRWLRHHSGPPTPCSQYIRQSALRRMIYMSVKELAVFAEDVIVVTSNIMKDMQPNRRSYIVPTQFARCVASSMHVQCLLCLRVLIFLIGIAFDR